MKGKSRRIVSGFLSALTIISSIVQPVTTYAAEAEPAAYEAEYPDMEKVKVTYHEAKNQNGQAFDGNKADTYHAVYFVEPVSGHPSYHVQRNIVVREPSAEIHKEKNAQDSESLWSRRKRLKKHRKRTYRQPRVKGSNSLSYRLSGNGRRS